MPSKVDVEVAERFPTDRAKGPLRRIRRTFSTVLIILVSLRKIRGTFSILLIIFLPLRRIRETSNTLLIIIVHLRRIRRTFSILLIVHVLLRRICRTLNVLLIVLMPHHVALQLARRRKISLTQQTFVRPTAFVNNPNVFVPAAGASEAFPTLVALVLAWTFIRLRPQRSFGTVDVPMFRGSRAFGELLTRVGTLEGGRLPVPSHVSAEFLEHLATVLAQAALRETHQVTTGNRPRFNTILTSTLRVNCHNRLHVFVSGGQAFSLSLFNVSIIIIIIISSSSSSSISWQDRVVFCCRLSHTRLNNSNHVNVSVRSRFSAHIYNTIQQYAIVLYT